MSEVQLVLLPGGADDMQAPGPDHPAWRGLAAVGEAPARRHFDGEWPDDLVLFEKAIAQVFAGRFTVVGECWEYSGGREKGYGRMRTERKRYLVHRFVLQLRLGRPLGDGFKALHHCDNPPCFRPSHIYEGTQKQNTDDRSARGRTATGPTHPKSKLTMTTAAQLRADRALGMSYRRLGAKYGISDASARAVALGRTWKQALNLTVTDTEETE